MSHRGVFWVKVDEKATKPKTFDTKEKQTEYIEKMHNQLAKQEACVPQQ